MIKPLASLLSSIVLLLSSTGFASVTEAEMRAFPMPPNKGYAANKSFAYVGDYGYFKYPEAAVYDPRNLTADSFQYVRYSGLAGKKVYVLPTWSSAVPPATATTDACPHTHMSFGVWAKSAISFAGPWGSGFSGWSFVGGGSMSGVRVDGRCVHKVDNPLSYIDGGRFGWGKSFLELDYRTYSLVSEIVVGVLANTHGWGTCDVPGGQFPACFEPANINAYTLAQ